MLATKKCSRKHVRCRADFHSIVQIDFDLDADKSDEFKNEMTGLVTEESKEGLRVIVVAGYEWAPGKRIKLKKGSNAREIMAEVRWCYQIDANSMMLGLFTFE